MSLINHTDGLAAVGKEDEPTLLVFPDALGLNRDDFHQVFQAALAQCNLLKDRFTICDIYNGQLDYTTPGGENVIDDAALGFRTMIGNNFLLYGAAYYPHLETTLTYSYDEEAVTVTGTFNGNAAPANTRLRVAAPANAADEARSIYHSANQLYHQIKMPLRRCLLYYLLAALWQAYTQQ